MRSGGFFTVGEAIELPLVGVTDNSSSKHIWETLFRVASSEGGDCMSPEQMLAGRRVVGHVAF